MQNAQLILALKIGVIATWLVGAVIHFTEAKALAEAREER